MRFLLRTRKTKAPAKAAEAKKAKTDGKLSALDAAPKVLADTREPMNCKSIIEAMPAQGPCGPAPVARPRT